MIRRVAVVGDGLKEARRPDLPDGVGYSVCTWHDDGTVTVDVREDAQQKIEELQTAVDQLVLDALMGGS